MGKATKSHMYSDYKGNLYFFYCGDCPAMFKKNPAKYSAKSHTKVLAGRKHYGYSSRYYSGKFQSKITRAGLNCSNNDKAVFPSAADSI